MLRGDGTCAKYEDRRVKNMSAQRMMELMSMWTLWKTFLVAKWLTTHFSFFDIILLEKTNTLRII